MYVNMLAPQEGKADLAGTFGVPNKCHTKVCVNCSHDRCSRSGQIPRHAGVTWFGMCYMDNPLYADMGALICSAGNENIALSPCSGI